MQIEWIDWNKIAMEKAKAVKAYICTDKRNPVYFTVVFAKTRGRAKSVAQTTECLHNTPFIYVVAKKNTAVRRCLSFLSCNELEERS